MFGALAHSQPQLLLPQGADQYGNAAACAAAGVAEALPTVDALAVADSARRLLADGEVAQRAAVIGAEIAAMPGPGEVVDELAGGPVAAA
jgi:UDP:flavonoid glycosyltransferase YjiC (YdhE family)